MHKNVYILCITIAMMQTGLYTWYRILPNYLSELGASSEDIGYAFTLLTVAYRLPQILGGWLADRLGLKFITIIGTLAMGICLILMQYAYDWRSLLYGLCGLFVVGALLYPGQLTYLSRSATRQNSAKAIGLFDFSSILGYLIGPLVGVLLMSMNFKMGELFIFSGSVYLFVGVMRYFLLTITTELGQEEVKEEQKVEKSMGKERVKILFLSMSGFLIYFMLWDGPFTALFLQDYLHLSKSQINVHATFTCVCAMVSALLFSRIMDQFKPKYFLMLVFLSIGLFSALFYIPALRQEPSYYLLALIVIPVEGYFIAYQKIVTNLGSSKNQALWVGIFGSLMGLIPALGIQWGGILYAQYGILGPMALSMLGSLLGFFFASLLV